MFNKILYPTDFSDVSMKVLDYIKELKNAGLKTIVLLHVIDARNYDCFEQGAIWAGQTPAELEDEYHKHAMEKSSKEMKIISEKIEKMGIKVISKLTKGVPFSEILKIEKEENVSAIIIGSHGKSNIEEMFLGSVSEKVIRKSSMPVIVVKR